jgi:hypothetical protein
MAGKISRISPRLITVIADVKRKHGIKNMYFTEATDYLAHMVEQDNRAFLRFVPDTRKVDLKVKIPKRKIQWY